MRNSENKYKEIIEIEEIIKYRIKSSFLHKSLTDQSVCLDCGSKNFTKLYERYKHDDTKIDQIIRDWRDYVDILLETVAQREIMDCSNEASFEKSFNDLEKSWIRIREINKRIKSLLRNDYIDPRESLNKNKNS